MAPVTRDEVAAELEEHVLSGALPVGAKLPSERQLAAQFGVGRPLVREALRTLAERGLVEIAPGRGTFARSVRSSDAARPLASLYRRQGVTTRDVVEARLMLEREGAALAVDRATDEELADLRARLVLFESATQPVERLEHDLRFHAGVVRLAHNPVLESMFGSIAPLAFQLMLSGLGEPRVVKAGKRAHRRILGALVARDAAAAQAAVDAHFAMRVGVFRELDQSLEPIARHALERVLGPSMTLEGVMALVDRGDEAA
jgi:DNA-binding FadR family transcriptional regulator